MESKKVQKVNIEKTAIKSVKTGRSQRTPIISPLDDNSIGKVITVEDIIASKPPSTKPYITEKGKSGLSGNHNAFVSKVKLKKRKVNRLKGIEKLTDENKEEMAKVFNIKVVNAESLAKYFNQYKLYLTKTKKCQV